MQVTESVELQSQTNSLMRAMDAFNEAMMLVDMKEGRWTVMFTNDAWLRFMGARATLNSIPCAAPSAGARSMDPLQPPQEPGPLRLHVDARQPSEHRGLVRGALLATIRWMATRPLTSSLRV